LHARLSWTGGAWTLHDLSHNGTRVNGSTAPRGQGVTLRCGDTLSFAGDSEVWELCDAEPPVAALFPLPGGSARSIPLSRMPVALPSEDALTGSAYIDSDGFAVLETESGVVPLRDGQVLDFSEGSFRVSLPQTLPSTAALGVLLEQTALHLQPSRTGEHVDASVVVQGRTFELRPRAHLLLLAHLARERANDRAAGMAAKDEGWADVEQLCRELQLTRETLNQHVLRVRKVFSELDIVDASGIIERRYDSDEIRLGAIAVELGTAR
jgi:hypothetical protein